MEFTINVNVTGLDKLADGLAALAGKTANPSRTAPNPAGPVSVVQYNAAPPQNAAPNPALTAKGAPFNVASQSVGVAPDPSQAPGGRILAGAVGNPAANAGASTSTARYAAAFGSMAGTAPAPNQAASSALVSDNPAPASTAQTGARSYTKDELAQPAGAWLSADPAKTAERSAMLRALCAEFGVGSLEQLAPEHYGAFALRLRQLGVAI